MAESKIFFTKCSLIPNGGSLEEEYNIVKGAPLVTYCESILNASISLTLEFIDIDQVIGRKGITGGEYLELTVKDGDEDEFKITLDHKMTLNAVTDMVTTRNYQSATLEFVSAELIVNETSRLNQKFSGNVSDTVKKILKDDKRGIKTEKKLFGPKDEKLEDGTKIKKDRATNSYAFVGNLKKPFETVQWLCPKTMSSKESFGFLFFETLDGYHFRSIKNLMDQEALRYEQADRQLLNRSQILQSRLNQTNDIVTNCRMGMYANKTIYVDIENQQANVVDFNVEQLNLKKKLKLNGLEKVPTRLMVRVNDFGVAQVDSKRSQRVPASELAVYQNKSYIRNNMLFSQSINISIPLNTTLRAGVLLDIRLPSKQDDGEGNAETDSYGDDNSNDPSGKYLIAELSHIMGRENAETQLTLIRDTFTA
tara:strand:+ start:9 stop:1277 length:1269 start_codon:yes stop_codon:yes gene_type:complete